jgi:hypothetical protein
LKNRNVQIALLEKGDNFKLYPIKRYEDYDKGTAYIFKRQGRLEYCFTLHSYKPIRINGKLTIGQREGSVCAVNLYFSPGIYALSSPLEASPIFDQVVPNSPGEEYAQLLRTHLISEETKTIVGATAIPWKIIIIIAIILIVVFVGYKIMSGGSAQVNTESNNPPLTTEQAIK